LPIFLIISHLGNFDGTDECHRRQWFIDTGQIVASVNKTADKFDGGDIDAKSPQ
jgi:hypothetical protein